jgi:hypothetical protein
MMLKSSENNVLFNNSRLSVMISESSEQIMNGRIKWLEHEYLQHHPDNLKMGSIYYQNTIEVAFCIDCKCFHVSTQ